MAAIALFFSSQYQLMIDFFDKTLPGFQTLEHAAHKAFSLPAGLIVYRLYFRSLLLIGGTSMERQLDKLKTKPHLVVGSPGRVRDLMRMGKLKTQAVRSVVLDAGVAASVARSAGRA